MINYEENKKKFDQYLEKSYPNMDKFERELKISMGIPNYSQNFPHLYQPIDDGNYTKIKWSTIPVGTFLLHRQSNDNWNQNRPLWCDYTGRIQVAHDAPIAIKDSFLLQPFYDITIEGNRLFDFGDSLMIFQVIKELNIIHFPFINDFTTSEFNVPASYESWIKHLCVHDENEICLNGYTMDFLTFYKSEGRNPLPTGFGTYFPHYREICILGKYNNSEYLQLLSKQESRHLLDHVINLEDIQSGKGRKPKHKHNRKRKTIKRKTKR
jgi:hypothetical protein